jgi:hypothetical protein
MKIERIKLDGETNCCCLEESHYNNESKEYETIRHTGNGYKIGYNCYCEECLKAINEGTKMLDVNKKVKSIEI